MQNDQLIARLRACAECEQAPLGPLLTEAANALAGMCGASQSREVDTLALANKITKALYPSIYGKQGITLEQGFMLMGVRGLVEDTLKAYFAEARG